MKAYPKQILALGPHTDDIELGCGGSISKFLNDGASVDYLIFSTCEESVPQEFPKDVLDKEAREAAGLMGIPSENLRIENFPVRNFPAHRQNILEILVSQGRKKKYDLILLPASFDIHQDHEVIHKEGVRAFKHSSIWGYELAWNTPRFEAELFVKLENSHFQAKIKALTAFKSQGFRPYLSEDFHKNHLSFRGLQAGHFMAEAFELIQQKID